MPFFTNKPELGEDAQSIVKIAANHCWLPCQQVVSAMGGAVFPTIRNSAQRMTLTECGQYMFDTNTTPRWALLWCHGYTQTHHPKGWTIAHVWPVSQDPKAYTNLANLCLMPEFFGSLSDKAGPLVPFLKYHAYNIYQWKPDNADKPEKPKGYDEIDWNYFKHKDDPKELIKTQMDRLQNRSVSTLRKLMGAANEA